MRNLGRCSATLICIVALAGSAALPGCDDADQPKRAVDARTEVLRFFSVDTPAVALLGPQPARNLAALDRAASGVPAWEILHEAVLAPLAAAGIGPADLRRLVQAQDEIEGVQSAGLALGPPGAGSPPGATLLVLATDQAEPLDLLFRDALGSGRVRGAGELHEARLFVGDEAAYAIRDGVLVSSPTLAGLRAALERRDGDSDAQLDEDVVNDLLGDLGIDGPLDVYADLEGVIESAPKLRSLAARTPWMEALGLGALSARAAGPALQVEMIAETDSGQVEQSELPAGEEPSRFVITAANVPALAPRRGDPGDPVVGLLRGLTPLVGEATATPDEIRAEAAVAP